VSLQVVPKKSLSGRAGISPIGTGGIKFLPAAERLEALDNGAKRFEQARFSSDF
jgi:hypothetical protein